ncbi:oxidoreductase NAD-binding domain-containing protein 1 isoform X2 [Salvelinus sp. IW2-2015]|uniref:oxidoreductase NAD-binding domain-containing protein 1 isoform X2 n=1 Tax=Salvelinus sp. IW2-2015 TaxID=2691554 RepID=UPI000CEA8D19|nr:oxidoreductase NAD-binding domain-containing protein 1-like isoform X1 [Salvelinus alpinus]
MSVLCILFMAARSFTLSGASGGLIRSRVLCSITRKMSSRRQMDHLERTASNYRQDRVYPARVCGIMDESETVKRLRLAVHPDFTFRAGQCPGLLQREGVIELAVKYTQHPPAHWIHTKCTMDSHVAMRVGGNFFFDPLPSDPCVDLLLVAGGVGINPLYSILLHAADLLRQNPANVGRGYNIGSTHLCYSAKNAQELLFKKTIIDVCKEFPEKFSCDFHITAQTADIDQELQPSMNRGRLSEGELRRHVDPNTTLCYLCDPPPMIESGVQTLLCLGLSQDRILFEKWW